MDEKQKPKHTDALDPIEIASGVMLLLALFSGLVVIGLVFLIVARLQQDPRFSVVINVFLVLLSLNVLIRIVLLIQKGYRRLLQTLRARRDAKIKGIAASPTSIVDYVIGDDGEVMEVVDEKRKRGGEANVK